MGFNNPYSDVPSPSTWNSDSQYESIGLTKNFKDFKTGGTEMQTNQPGSKRRPLSHKYKKHGLRRQRYRG